MTDDARVAGIPARQLEYARGLLASLRDETTPERGVTGALCRAIDDFIRTGEVPENVKLEGVLNEQFPEPEDAVQWIVNDNAELGVMVGGNAHFLYKGHSLIYEDGKHDDGRPLMYRPVFKREFGECCHPINYDNLNLIGKVSLDDSDQWKPVPPKRTDSAPKILRPSAGDLSIVAAVCGRTAKELRNLADEIDRTAAHHAEAHAKPDSAPEEHRP